MITFSIFTELEKLSAVFGNQVNYQSLTTGVSFCPVFANWRNFMTHGRGILVFSWKILWVWSWSRKYPFFWPDQLLFVTHNCMSGSAESDAGLAPGSVSTGLCHEAPTSLCWVTSGPMCQLWWMALARMMAQIFKSRAHGQCQGKYWSVIASPADTAPPCQQCRAHPSWDLRSRVTARWFLSPTALHYHSPGLGISQRRVMSGVNMGHQGLTASDGHGHWPLDDEGLTQWCQKWGAGKWDIQ